MRLRISSPHRIAVGMLAAGLTFGLSGCYYTSPQLVPNYEAADGVNGTLGEGLSVYNIHVVREKSTVKGMLFGTLENKTDSDVSVQFVADGAEPQTLDVPANTTLALTAENSFLFNKTPQAGSNLNTRLNAPGFGSLDLIIPVKAPTDFYSDVLPSPTDVPAGEEVPAEDVIEEPADGAVEGAVEGTVDEETVTD